MALEIERKFLLASDAWRREADHGVVMRQGYISNAVNGAVRVRIAGDGAWLTIKGATEGVSRTEFEYPIPAEDASDLMALCQGPLIEKTRYRVQRGPHIWEIDVFAGENAGLVLAEIELSSADESFEHPAWIGSEVSDDPRYFNAQLSVSPYRSWDA
ncbi:MAG: CYTH domain-containing protein [Pseudomonadota bacterium]